MSDRLTVSEWKALLSGLDASHHIAAAQQDDRASVQKLAAAYIKKQQKLWEEMQRVAAMYSHEDAFYQSGTYAVAGVDEVGRGPVVGPVVIGAVILPPHCFIEGLNDSKKLSEKKREAIYDQIVEQAVAYSVISYDNEAIDRYNIYQATQMAMYDAIRDLSVPAEAVLVDAMPLDRLSVPYESIIHGDSVSASIAAASILAKVTRDRYMVELDAQYPAYGFASHKGYLTKEHMAAIDTYGPTPYHRKSFEPIKSLVGFDREYWYMDEA